MKYHAASMNDKEQFYYYIPESLDQAQPTKWAIRLFFTCILGVVCSVLRWFACFSPPIVPNSGGDLLWFAVVCLIVIPVTRVGVDYTRNRL